MIGTKTLAQATATRYNRGGHIIIGGENYGQESSREHAALAPSYLGLKLVITKSFARIHWANLINFGILPVTFSNSADFDSLELNDVLLVEDIHNSLKTAAPLTATIKGKEQKIALEHSLSPRQVAILTAGGLINWIRNFA